ncbi:glycosyltransferase family 2 protein [Lachnospiraceae bacterium AM23-2LB]|nr:glycosyltransferase family 2 protein [Lachnospiraceae bacterium AM23-2LB]RJW00980.1 glycosyltransferase family 2 protein [Lachnospiraceae bacterium AM40-2BH]
MNEKPLFTIGIASYNYANYIKRLLSSIKEQTFKDYEILISDDFSTDNSLQVINEFIEENPDICVRLIVAEKNEGLVANKNKLIENCKGKYLMLCDADDWMSKDCLAEMAQKIEIENPDRVISQVAHIDQNNNILQIEYIPSNQTKWGWNLHHGSVYKTDILKENNIFIKQMPDDVYLTVDFAQHSSKLSIIHKTLYYWLVHTDSEGRKKINFNETYVQATFCEVLKHVTKIIDDLDSSNIKEQRDIQELKLVRLKLYYFYILFVFQNETYKDKIKYYNQLHSCMNDLDKNYMQTQCLSKNSEIVLREYPMKAIRLCTLLEKIHLMKLGLFGYHLITRFKYFDQ